MRRGTYIHCPYFKRSRSFGERRFGHGRPFIWCSTCGTDRDRPIIIIERVGLRFKHGRPFIWCSTCGTDRDRPIIIERGGLCFKHGRPFIWCSTCGTDRDRPIIIERGGLRFKHGRPFIWCAHLYDDGIRCHHGRWRCRQQWEQ